MFMCDGAAGAERGAPEDDCRRARGGAARAALTPPARPRRPARPAAALITFH